MERIGKLLSLAPLASAIPKTVSSGSCQDVVVAEPDLTQLPVLTTWPLDAGPFITLLLVPVLYSIFVLDLKIVNWETRQKSEL
mgnify:CR=1 FL=1